MGGLIRHLTWEAVDGEGLGFLLQIRWNRMCLMFKKLDSTTLVSASSVWWSERRQMNDTAVAMALVIHKTGQRPDVVSVVVYTRLLLIVDCETAISARRTHCLWRSARRRSHYDTVLTVRCRQLHAFNSSCWSVATINFRRKRRSRLRLRTLRVAHAGALECSLDSVSAAFVARRRRPSFAYATSEQTGHGWIIITVNKLATRRTSSSKKPFSKVLFDRKQCCSAITKL